MKKLALKLINWYKRVTVNAPKLCKYYPTCSTYAMECYQNYNFFKASLLTTWRLLRCNPFSKGGYDPIPIIKKTLTKEEIDNYFVIDWDLEEEDRLLAEQKKEESYSDSSSFK